MSHSFKTKLVAFSACFSFMLTGCENVKIQANKQAEETLKNISDAEESAPAAMPIVTKTSAAWLMGESVPVAPPESPKLMQRVSYSSPVKVSLVDIAAYVSREIGLPIDTSDVQATPSSAMNANLPGAGSIPGAQMLPTPNQLFGSQNSSNSGQLPLMNVSYEGPARGLLEYAANKSGVYFKYADGRGQFFRTVSEYIEISAVSKKTATTSAMAAFAGSTSGGSSQGGASGSSASSNSTNGGITNTDTYNLDPWDEIEKTAKIVAGGSSEPKVKANPGLSLLAIIGTPTQVKNVRDWAKSLNQRLTQQVAITATIYTVDITNEMYYQWDPTIIFGKAASAVGLSLSAPQSPTIQAGINPFSAGANIINNATTGASSNFNGTKLAVQALSTIGNVSGSMRQSVVAINGQQATLQIGKVKGFIYSSATTQTANVGSTATITPGSVTVGFTGLFTPQVVNGRIILSMDIINATLDELKDRSSGGSTIQTPDTSPSFFKNAVILASGQTLMLTGVTQDTSNSRDNGVGSPSFKVLGGGADYAVGKKLVAIVISAKVL